MLKFTLVLCGLLLLFGGAYSLPLEGFPYTKQHTARLGPFEASARTRERIDVPAPLGWVLVNPSRWWPRPWPLANSFNFGIDPWQEK